MLATRLMKKSATLSALISLTTLPLITIACNNEAVKSNIIIDPTPRNPALTLTNDQKNAAMNVIGQGSSSVMPIINLVKSVFTNMQYLPSGSGAGFNAMLQTNLANAFGMTSSLRYPRNEANYEAWVNNAMRTVTFSRDAISIIVNLPSGLTLMPDPNQTQVRPIVNIHRLADLYDSNNANDPTWAELITNANLNSASAKQKPTAFGRNGGAEASGTSDAFWALLKNYLSPGQTADLNHEHLPPRQLTGEANSLASDVVNVSRGSVTYLSLGFALQNEASSNYQAARLQVNDKTWNPSVDDVKLNTYLWTRNFNVLYPTANVAARYFVQYLLSDAGQAFSELAGFIPLATTPFNTLNEITRQAGVDGALLALSDLAYYQSVNQVDEAAAKAAILQGKVGL